MPYKDPTKNSACKKAWSQSERGRAWFRARYLADAEKFKQNQRDQRRANPEANAKAWRTWRESNPERFREATNAWARAHPEVGLASVHRRRARILGGGGPGVSAEEWRQVVDYFNGACAYCLKPCSRPERDHMLPIVAGGRDSPDNVVPACQKCNRTKGRKDLLQYLGTRKVCH